MKFEPQFRLAFPQTVGETDKEYDLSNYTEWLESLAEERFTSHNTGSPKLRENTMELLEAVSTMVGGTSVPSREELDCAAEQLDICIAQLRASA